MELIEQNLRLSPRWISLDWIGHDLHWGLSSATLLRSLSASFVFSIYRDTRASSWAESSIATPSRRYSLTVRRGKPTATPTSQTLNLISSPTVKPSWAMTCCRPPDGNKARHGQHEFGKLDHFQMYSIFLTTSNVCQKKWVMLQMNHLIEVKLPSSDLWFPPQLSAHCCLQALF